MHHVVNPKHSGKRPAILIFPTWEGRSEWHTKKAEYIASLGYIAIAVDVYGKDQCGKSKEENIALVTPYFKERSLLQKSVLEAYEFTKNLENVDKSRIGAIGFCFGGMCALDLARSGADVKGCVSFHGILTPSPIYKKPITSKILVLHGDIDPQVPPDQVVAFREEMHQKKVDWEMDVYGNTYHAFTREDANDLDFGTVYNPEAKRVSFRSMELFFKDLNFE